MLKIEIPVKDMSHAGCLFPEDEIAQTGHDDWNIHRKWSVKPPQILCWNVRPLLPTSGNIVTYSKFSSKLWVNALRKQLDYAWTDWESVLNKMGLRLGGLETA